MKLGQQQLVEEMDREISVVVLWAESLPGRRVPEEREGMGPAEVQNGTGKHLQSFSESFNNFPLHCD